VSNGWLLVLAWSLTLSGGFLAGWTVHSVVVAARDESTPVEEEP
jgi:hypothetical protein